MGYSILGSMVGSPNVWKPGFSIFCVPLAHPNIKNNPVNSRGFERGPTFV